MIEYYHFRHIVQNRDFYSLNICAFFLLTKLRGNVIMVIWLAREPPNNRIVQIIGLYKKVEIKSRLLSFHSVVVKCLLLIDSNTYDTLNRLALCLIHPY